MTSVTENIVKVRDRIAAAATRFGRDPGHIHLIAVSKRQSVEKIRDAIHAGQNDFGENYLQEASEKQDALEAASGLVWHFIGRVQANKTRGIASRFQWVHTIERGRIAERLSRQRPYYAPPLQVCLQVEVTGDPSRPGACMDSLEALAEVVAGLPRIQFRGLMCLPPEETEFERQRAHFRRLRECQAALLGAGFELDVLSAGMSGDLEAAIAEGATHVRIGTAVFGERLLRSD